MKKDRVTVISFLILLIFSFFFLYRNIKGLGYLQFTDESGHFLGAIAIHRGDRLYAEYMDAHGPLIYMLSWLVGLFTGFHNIWLLRLVSTFCALGATLSVFYSGLFQQGWQRCLATALWLGMLANVWIVQGLYLDNYWTIGGSLAVIVMATLLLPLFLEQMVSKPCFFLGGAALVLLPFTAYPFALISVFFTFALLGLWVGPYRNHSREFIIAGIGGLCAFCGMGIWLLLYADIGGMIAYHFMLNQMDYANYIPLDPMHFLKSLLPSLAPYCLVQTLASFAFLTGSILLLFLSRYRISAVFFLLGVLAFQIRGGFEFQNGAFLMTSLALVTLMIIRIMGNRSYLALFLTLAGVGLTGIVSWHATSTPSGQSAEERHHTPWHPFMESDDPVSQQIRFYTGPEERILAIPYSPDIYILANRLSMKKYHEYLPWEMDYATHPWHGYVRNICIDLPKDEPPLIHFNHWVVWGIYPPEKFMGCVLDVLKKDYIRLSPTSELYVRKDRYFQKHQ